MINKLKDLYSFFDRIYKLRLFYIQILIIISAVFEILGIFSIGPLVQLLNNPDIIFEQEEVVSKVYNYFDFGSFKTYLIFVVIVIFSFLFISTAILTVTIYIMSNFSQDLGNILRSNLFKFYISQKWIYHSRSNTSEYIQKISYETNRVTNNIILPVLVTNSKLITGILIIISLTIYNPIISIVCFLLFGLLYFYLFSTVKSKISEYGKNQSSSNSKMYRIMSESFLGIKEAIIYGNQKKYFDQFHKNSKEYSFTNAIIQFLANAPRHVLEFIAISIILTFILVVIYLNKTNFNESLPVIAIYIFAGYKLLPIFQNIYVGFVQVKNALPSFDKIHYELLESKKVSLAKDLKINEKFIFNNDQEISLKNVSFHYKSSSLKAINNIKISIKKNSLNYIVGSSGSGKSTILDLILGLIYPSEGKIYIGEKEINYFNAVSWHQHIGYVGQNIFLLDDTIKNNICFVDEKEKIDEQRLNNALKISNVDFFLKDLSDGINTLVGDRGIKLSGGQRQRVALARAFYQNKEIIVLDEATASLDGIAEKHIIDQLKILSKTKTIIMVTHNVKLCKQADMIYLLEKGHIRNHGNYEEIKKDELFLNLLNEK